MELTKDKKYYYVEPVEIEIYLKNISKVRTIIKDLYIELIDAEPINENSKLVFNHFKEKNEPIDLNNKVVDEGQNVIKARELSGRKNLLFPSY